MIPRGHDGCHPQASHGSSLLLNQRELHATLEAIGPAFVEAFEFAEGATGIDVGEGEAPTSSLRVILKDVADFGLLQRSETKGAGLALVIGVPKFAVGGLGLGLAAADSDELFIAPEGGHALGGLNREICMYGVEAGKGKDWVLSLIRIGHLVLQFPLLGFPSEGEGLAGFDRFGRLRDGASGCRDASDPRFDRRGRLNTDGGGHVGAEVALAVADPVAGKRDGLLRRVQEVELNLIALLVVGAGINEEAKTEPAVLGARFGEGGRLCRGEGQGAEEKNEEWFHLGNMAKGRGSSVKGR